MNSKEKTMLKDVVIRFCGDSGDGMQLTGTLFSNLSAILGNEIATFPDYPADMRAPQGTVGGVSGFQVHVGSGIYTPGDEADVLVAMNSAALKVNYKVLKKMGVLIFDTDSFDKKNMEKALRRCQEIRNMIPITVSLPHQRKVLQRSAMFSM